PRAPWPRPAQGGGAARSLLRRADVLVAAGLLLVVGGVALTWVGRSWYNQHVYACQNNLRQLHQALWAYSDQHDGEFPRLEPQPRRSAAGTLPPASNAPGALPATSPLPCPANGPPAATRLPSLAELQELQRTRPDEFRQVVQGLGGCYAYTLGYGEPAAHHG